MSTSDVPVQPAAGANTGAARTGPAEFEKVLTQSDQTVASFEEGGRGPLRQLQHFLHRAPTVIPLIVLVLAVLAFGVKVGPRFYAPNVLSTILQQVTVVAMAGIGQTLVILTAGIDLSIGYILIISHVAMGLLAVMHGWPVPLAILAGLVVGLACGGLNGALVTYLRLPPFIVTLGTLSIFRALNSYFSGNQTISFMTLDAQAPSLPFLGNTFRIGGAQILYGSVLMLIVAAVIWYLLNRTALGRHVLALGDDTEAARLAGINTRGTLLFVYAAAGLIAAIGGWVLIGRGGSISPNSGENLNLDSITAVVIGGTSLFGGRGSIVGTLFGALIVGVFRTGLVLAGVQVLWQEFAIGVLVISAVAIDQWIRRVSA